MIRRAKREYRPANVWTPSGDHTALDAFILMPGDADRTGLKERASDSDGEHESNYRMLVEG